MAKQKTPASGKRGSHPKGQKRFDEIVDSALELLIDRGYHNFSIRKVAESVGISVGNLQYYFPTKDALVQAMLDDTLRDYTDTFDRIRHRGTAKQQLTELVNTITEDLSTRKTTFFFPELWSLSNHEKSVNKMMEDLYSHYRGIMAEIIVDINPAISAAQATRLALFFTCSIEGHTVFIGYKKPWKSETKNIARLATQSFLWLIEHGDIPE